MLAQRVRRGSASASEREARRAGAASLRNEPVGPLGAVKDVSEPVPSHVEETLHSPGEPLDEPLRTALEPRLGHDFSRVRVHSDDQAASSARQLHARAYAFGQDLVFGRNRYDPGSLPGRTLIAHELAHVVQQARGGGPALQLDSELETFPEAERQQIQVLTAGLAAAGDVIADQYFRAAGSIIKIPPERRIQLGATVADELKEGLKRVAAGLTLTAPGVTTPVLRENSSLTVALHAAKRTVRFTRFRHTAAGAAGAKTVEDVVLVEDLGKITKAPLASPTEYQTSSPLWHGGTLPYKEATKLAECTKNTGDPDRCRRDVLGEKLVPIGPAPGTVLKKESLEVQGVKLKREAGWTWKDWNQIQGVLEALPKAILEEAAGSSWLREAAPVCTAAALAAKACDPAWAASTDGFKQTITVYDKAFETTSTRFGTSTELQQKISHEIGHLADYKPVRGKADPTKHHTLSGRGIKKGTLGGKFIWEDVVERKTTGDFQKAAIADGLVTKDGQIVSGGLTDYGQTGWKELFPESFSLYATDPELLKAIRPNIYNYFAARYPTR